MFRQSQRQGERMKKILLVFIVSAVLLASYVAAQADSNIEYVRNDLGQVTQVKVTGSISQTYGTSDLTTYDLVRDEFSNVVEVIKTQYTGQLGNPTKIGPYSTTYEYEKNMVVKISDPRGRKVIIERDGVGRVTSIRYPDGTRTKWGYDKEGKVTSVEDRLGVETRVLYSCSGKGAEEIYSQNQKVPIVKNAGGHIISIGSNVVVPGSFSLEPKIGGVRTDPTSFIDPVSISNRPYTFQSNYDLLGKNPERGEINQADFDKALDTQIQAISGADENLANQHSIGLYRRLRLGQVSDRKADVIYDKLIQENPNLAARLNAVRNQDLAPQISRDVKLEDIKYEYDDNGKIINITTQWGKIPAATSFERDSSGRTQAITHSDVDKSITHDALTGQYITGDKDLENKYSYDLRGFPGSNSGVFLSTQGNLFPNPIRQEPTINRVFFYSDGKLHTLVRDKLGRPVATIMTGSIKATKTLDRATILNRGVDRLALVNELGDPLALYTQFGDNPSEINSIEGNTLYLHADSSGKVVEVKDASGKSLNKFDYDPSRQMYSENIVEQLRKDSDINRLDPNQLGAFMQFALGVMQTSFEYEDKCEPSPTPTDTGKDSWRNIDCNEIAKGIPVYVPGLGVKECLNGEADVPLLQHHGEGGDFTRRDVCSHYCAWPIIGKSDDIKIMAFPTTEIIRVDFDEGGKFRPSNEYDYNMESSNTKLKSFVGKTISEILEDATNFLGRLGVSYYYPPKESIVSESAINIGDGGWYVHYATEYTMSFTDDGEIKATKYAVSLFFKKDNCLVKLSGDADEDYDESNNYHPYDQETGEYGNKHPSFDHDKEAKDAVLTETLKYAREVDAAIGTKCKLKP